MTDFGNTKYPVAAKPHRCEWCGQTIEKGEKHAHFTGKWEGDFQDWRMHQPCHEFANDCGELAEGFQPYANERVTPAVESRP